MNLLDQSLDSIIDAAGSPNELKPMQQRYSPYGSGRDGRGRGSGRRNADANSGSGRIGDELDKNVVFPGVVIRVGSQQSARDIAEEITQACRQGIAEMPACTTIGPSSINQAVKGIAIACTERSEKGFQLSFQPAFRHEDKARPLIAFYLVQERRRNAYNFDDEFELTVSATAKIGSVAGAIAGKTREGQRVCLVAMGVDAVTNAVLAIGHARLYLEGDGMDIKAQPEFEKVDKDGEERTALRLHVICETVRS